MHQFLQKHWRQTTSTEIKADRGPIVHGNMDEGGQNKCKEREGASASALPASIPSANMESSEDCNPLATTSPKSGRSVLLMPDNYLPLLLLLWGVYSPLSAQPDVDISLENFSGLTGRKLGFKLDAAGTGKSVVAFAKEAPDALRSPRAVRMIAPADEVKGRKEARKVNLAANAEDQRHSSKRMMMNVFKTPQKENRRVRKRMLDSLSYLEARMHRQSRISKLREKLGFLEKYGTEQQAAETAQALMAILNELRDSQHPRHENDTATGAPSPPVEGAAGIVDLPFSPQIKIGVHVNQKFWVHKSTR